MAARMSSTRLLGLSVMVSSSVVWKDRRGHIVALIANSHVLWLTLTAASSHSPRPSCLVGWHILWPSTIPDQSFIFSWSALIRPLRFSSLALIPPWKCSTLSRTSCHIRFISGLDIPFLTPVSRDMTTSLSRSRKWMYWILFPLSYKRLKLSVWLTPLAFSSSWFLGAQLQKSDCVWRASLHKFPPPPPQNHVATMPPNISRLLRVHYWG
jgi:hypothetical protein